MRLTVLFCALLFPAMACAADAPRVKARTLVITRTAMASPVPQLGPYSCAPHQLRAGCWNFLNSSSHGSLAEGSATCVCSRIGR